MSPAQQLWGWFATVPVWQIALPIVAIWILGKALLRFWPRLRKTVELVSALLQLPGFIIRTDQTLSDQNKKIDSIHHEVHFNNGSSVKDAIHRVESTIGANTEKLEEMQANQARIEKGVAGLYTREEIDAKNIALSKEIEHTRPRAQRPAAKRRSYKPKEPQ